MSDNNSLDYSEFFEMAESMIGEAGCSMEYVKRIESGNIDARTGKRITNEEKIKFIGLVTRPQADEIQAGIFEQNNMVILMPGTSLDKADITDLIRFNDCDYAIQNIVKVAPAGETILYKFGVINSGKTQIE